MNKAASPNRWYAPWSRAPEREEDDPAGLGTAFGLDLSMAPDALQGEPAAPTVPAESRRSWMSRLSATRKRSG